MNTHLYSQSFIWEYYFLRRKVSLILTTPRNCEQDGIIFSQLYTRQWQSAVLPSADCPKWKYDEKRLTTLRSRSRLIRRKTFVAVGTTNEKPGHREIQCKIPGDLKRMRIKTCEVSTPGFSRKHWPEFAEEASRKEQPFLVFFRTVWNEHCLLLLCTSFRSYYVRNQKISANTELKNFVETARRLCVNGNACELAINCKSYLWTVNDGGGVVGDW